MQRLRELGWIEGRTVKIECRWAEGRVEALLFSLICAVNEDNQSRAILVTHDPKQTSSGAGQEGLASPSIDPVIHSGCKVGRQCQPKLHER